MKLTKWEAKRDESWKERGERKDKMERKLGRETEMESGRGKWK
jgi:hypothetical protein